MTLTLEKERSNFSNACVCVCVSVCDGESVPDQYSKRAMPLEYHPSTPPPAIHVNVVTIAAMFGVASLLCWYFCYCSYTESQSHIIYDMFG